MKFFISVLTTDSRQSVISQVEQDTHLISYECFGYATDKNVMGARFNGQYREGLTELYMLGNGYRAYSTRWRRFLGADSESPFGKGGINAYAYCQGDPINYSDPSGHFLRAFFGLAPRHRQLKKILATSFPGEFSRHSNNEKLTNFLFKREKIVQQMYAKEVLAWPPRKGILMRKFSTKRPGLAISNSSALRVRTQIKGARRDAFMFIEAGTNQNPITGGVLSLEESWLAKFAHQIQSPTQGNWKAMAEFYVTAVIGTPGTLPSPKVMTSLMTITTPASQTQNGGRKLFSVRNTAVRKT